MPLQDRRLWLSFPPAGVGFIAVTSMRLSVRIFLCAIDELIRNLCLILSIKALSHPSSIPIDAATSLIGSIVAS